MLRSLIFASLLLVTATVSADQPRMSRSPRKLMSREKIESNVEAFKYQTDAGNRLEEIVGPDTVDVYEYAASGQPHRLVTSYRGLTFEATMTDEEIIVPGFPRLQLAYKDRIRLRSIQADGRTLLSYVYDNDENVRTVRLDSDYSLQLKETRKGWVRHTLRGPSGKILRDRDVPSLAANRPQPWEPLDIVRDDFGLGEDWLHHLKGQWNSTGSVITLRNESTLFAYLWRFNGLEVGYDLKGQPVYLALYMDHYTRSTQLLWGLPDVFTMTPDGRIGMHSRLPMKSGLDGFWTNRHNGERVLEYRFIDEEAKPQSSGPASEMAYNCGSSTVCYSYSDSSYEYCTTTLYYCEAWGGGGGSYDPSFEPAPGGGGSTTTTTTTRFNYLSGTLGAAVGRAIANAKTKLNNSACQHTFSEFHAQDGILLADKLRARNTTASDYLTVPMTWRPGSGVADARGIIPCNSSTTVAWTSPGSTTVYVCDQFETRLSPVDATRRIIHEELHSLGLAENPPVAGAPTDADIDNAISNNCR